MQTPPYGGSSGTNQDLRRLAGWSAAGLTLFVFSLIWDGYYNEVHAFFRSIYGHEWADLATLVSGGILGIISYYVFKIAIAAALILLFMQLPRLVAA